MSKERIMIIPEEMEFECSQILDCEQNKEKSSSKTSLIGFSMIPMN